jgi:nitrite reductase/ring-hydroxylating ferredoxin subunit/uncharacterized membrane protein
MNEVTRAFEKTMRTIERAEPLDDVARSVQGYARKLTRNPAVKRVLSGAPLGHRLHPMLTDVTIGCWTSASLLDLLAPRSGRSGAGRLVGAGIVSAVPTAASGLSDWSDTQGASRRVGLVHLASNTMALVLELQSWSARRKGHHIRGALLGLGGLAAVTVGGYLGGHLSFVLREGVNAEVGVLDDEEWHEAWLFDDLVDDQPVGVTIDDARIVLVRRRGRVFALAAVCTHAGGPLDQGEVQGDVIVCPWHGSEFCLWDGVVERGPAVTPEPVYATRVRAGTVEVHRVEDPAERFALGELSAPAAAAGR